MGALGILAIIVGFPVVFVAFWSLVSRLLAAMSGWSSMTETYRCPEGLEGTPLPSGMAVRVGMTRYRGGALTFEATTHGLIARVMRLFPFHPALLFPWGTIRVERARGAFYAGEMRVAGGSTFHLDDEAISSIERAMPR